MWTVYYFETSTSVKSTSLKDKDKEVMEKRESLYLICTWKNWKIVKLLLVKILKMNAN